MFPFVKKLTQYVREDAPLGRLINIHSHPMPERKEKLMTKIIPEKLLVAAVNAINAMGPTPLSEKIFMENIVPGYEKEARRSVAIANYVALVSPTRLKCDWYTVALFSIGTPKILMPEEDKVSHTEFLLQSCGIPSRYTAAIREVNSALPPSEISALALAIRFADIHVDDNGRYVKLKNGVRLIKKADTGGVERELMNLCYELEKTGKYDKWLNALDSLCKGGQNGGQEKQVSRQPEVEAAGTAS